MAYVTGQLLDPLLPHLSGVEIERVEPSPGLVRILARTRGGQAACPSCGTRSARVHSRYQRRLADAAMGGRRTMILLSARRLFCNHDPCPRRTLPSRSRA